MNKATKIIMKKNCESSYKVREIDEIYIEGPTVNNGWYKKEKIHDYIKKEDGEIHVDFYPTYPKLQAVTTQTEKYVRSMPNDSEKDNLLALPRFTRS